MQNSATELGKLDMSAFKSEVTSSSWRFILYKVILVIGKHSCVGVGVLAITVGTNSAI